MTRTENAESTRPDGAPGRELVLQVPDMDCTTCARRISDRLQGLNGVETVQPRVVSRDVRVAFDPGRVGEETIAQAVRGLGYTIGQAGGAQKPAADPREGVWATAEARRTYVSGGLIGVGLLLRLAGASAVLWSRGLWTVDVAAALFVASALVGGWNFFPKGFRAARIVRLDMNFLMTVAIFGALGVGEFVEAASIAFLFGIAELLEGYSVDRARRSIEALLDLAPATARLLRGGEERMVPVAELQPGDRVGIRPGEKVPIDGHVRDGRSAVDESPITGESMPVDKGPADYVYAGTMNGQGYLEVEAAKRATDTTLAHIIHLVEEAETSRAPSERFVARFARYYTPAVTILAVTLMVVPPLALGASFTTWFVRGLTLLVISCPCAMVISTPVAVVSGITSAARHGVLIKGGTFLEALGDVQVVAFDKTGTLTAGRPEVVGILTGPNGRMSEDELIGIAAALEARSEHPIGDAIRRRAAATGDGAASQVTEFEALPGRGARARIGGTRYQIGRPDLFGQATAAWSAELEHVGAAGRTPICVGTAEEILGVVAVADRPRRDARGAVAGLRRLGVERIVMLTGDHEATARAMARELGIEEYYAGLMPEEKVEKVRELEGTVGRVAMVGDGVNDAPALAAAAVGIAMGAAGSDAALESADVALMSDDLSGLPYLFQLSRRSTGVIRQNILASITLKLSLAAGVFPGWVSLITAVLVGDMGASLGVTVNALRLARLRR